MPVASASFATTSSFGASKTTTASYWPSTRYHAFCLSALLCEVQEGNVGGHDDLLRSTARSRVRAVQAACDREPAQSTAAFKHSLARCRVLRARSPSGHWGKSPAGAKPYSRSAWNPDGLKLAMMVVSSMGSTGFGTCML